MYSVQLLILDIYISIYLHIITLLPTRILLPTLNQEALDPVLQLCIYRCALAQQEERISTGDELGITSSMFRGTRLKGSLVSESRCDLIVDRSMTALDDGSVTGSRMTVNMRGSSIALSIFEQDAFEDTYLKTHPAHLPALPQHPSTPSQPPL